MQISARTTRMANEDGTCFKVLAIMSKKDTCEGNLVRDTAILRRRRQRRIDIHDVRQKETKAYLLDKQATKAIRTLRRKP